MVPKRAARSWAARSPTMRMPSALSRRVSPRFFEASIAAMEVLGRLLREALEVGQGVDVEPVEIGEVAHEPAVHELADDHLAQVLDVHGPARARSGRAAP